MIKKTVILLIEIYQAIFSPDRGILRKRVPTCRFYPSCSEYAKQAVMRYGTLAGLAKGAARISRCHPFHKGGYDPLS